MNSIKNILLILACTSFVTIIGAGTYEHVTMVPIWKLAPPASLTMFQGEYGIDTGRFWMAIHPVTLLLMIAALISNWKTARRKYILITMAGYVIVLLITALYFVPELIAITHTPFSTLPDNGLIERASLWEKLSLIRAVGITSLAFMLLFSLTKGNEVHPGA